MRISVSVTNYSYPDAPDAIAERLSETAVAADEAGLDVFWVNDHLVQAAPGAAPESEMLEAYTTLGYLAARTNQIQLGTMVTPVTMRLPAVLIKAVTSLDVLSGGRAWLGVGAGYKLEEAEAMGLPLPPTQERFARLEETVQLAHQMWAGDTSPFKGEYYQLARPVSSPPPLQRPHPPILIGGTGERHTLALVARYADACNLFDIPDGGKTIRHKLQVLARQCEAAGRPFDAIEKTVSARLTPSEPIEKFVAHCEKLAGLGIQHVVLITDGPWTVERIEHLAQAVRPVNGIQAANPY
ncbi:MAG: TIGR03560 family F420-dependent LLM class oxidoreductase [Actinomycetes bacterium]